MRSYAAIPVIAVFATCLCLPVLNRPKVLADLAAPVAGVRPAPTLVESRWRASFPLRNEGKQLVSLVRGDLLAAYGTAAVVVGTDGWLYYRSEMAGDGHSFDALRGLAPWSAARCAQVAGEIRRRDAQARSWGGRYAVVVVPDKAVIHPEGLPRHLRPLPGRSRADQLLAAAGDLALDLRPALLRARADHPDLPLYWRSDTHWNEWGRLVASSAILAHLTGEPAALPLAGTLRRVPAAGVPDPFDPSRTRPGELYQLLEQDRAADPAWMADDTVAGLPPVRTRQSAPFHSSPLGWIPQPGGHRVPWDAAFFMHGRCDGAPLPGRLLVLHDSFGAFPMGALADRYRDSTFLWTHQWDDDAAARLRPAVVVHIIAERYLDALVPP